MTRTFLAIGEPLIEMSAGSSQGEWRMGFAGDTMNTSWYARALLDPSWTVSYFTALGGDRYSQQLKQFITNAGINTSAIATIAERCAGLYFIHQENGDRQFTYWRDMSAAKLLVRDEPALENALNSADVIYFSGITLAILSPEDRERFLEAIAKRRSAGATICFDQNIRPRLWNSEQEIRDWLTKAAAVSDFSLPTFGDEQDLFGDADTQATIARYTALGVREVVVKNGRDPAHIHSDGREVTVAATLTDNVVDATGAGDSFNGAYLAARLKGVNSEEAAALAHRVAAICIGHHGALVPREALSSIRIG